MENNLVRADKTKNDLKQRLKKISGQVAGIDKMIDEERYCVDVIQQILSVRGALNQVALIVIKSHAKSYIVRAREENHAEKSIKEILNVLKQFNQ